MRLKLYLDTSVLGAVCDPGPEDRLAATRRILDGLRAGSWDGYIARHIAIATLNDINVIVSWNFRHMVNVERKRRINSVNLREGCPLIDIVSPWEISDEEA